MGVKFLEFFLEDDRVVVDNDLLLIHTEVFRQDVQESVLGL